jgi:hypothetical protein
VVSRYGGAVSTCGGRCQRLRSLRQHHWSCLSAAVADQSGHGVNPSAGGERWSACAVSWSALAAYRVAACGAFVSGCGDLVSACMASVITRTYIVSARILLVSARIGSASARNRACAACVALRTLKRRRTMHRVGCGLGACCFIYIARRCPLDVQARVGWARRRRVGGRGGRGG